jgi:hypothetical protein
MQPTMDNPRSPQHRVSPMWRRALVFFIGGIFLVIGLAMLILPGPAVVFIPLGLAILATEFSWARSWLTTTQQWIRVRIKKTLASKR